MLYGADTKSSDFETGRLAGLPCAAYQDLDEFCTIMKMTGGGEGEGIPVPA